MKVFITFLFLLMLLKISVAQEYFYYYEREKVPLVLSNEKVFVKFKESKTENEKREIIATIPFVKPVEKKAVAHPNNIVILDITSGKSKAEVKTIINSLNKIEDVIVSNPFCIYMPDSTLQGITDQFVVKLKSPLDFNELEKLSKETNTILLKQNEFEPSVYILIADKNSNGNALEMANYFFETGKFEFAEPAFYRIVRTQCTNDEFFNQQWGLQNTGQHSGISGADINICQAWQITRGRKEVSVAVIDEGVDLNHPDLINNLLPGFDATGGGNNGGPQGDDAHGTACAGIIAAQGNNIIGISGIAPNCRIIPVRIIVDGSIQYDYWAADGINWAWQNGADILSNSWRFGSQSSLITLAINNATTQGRNGLGCPVLFAAGNYNTSVIYPANLSNTIAVGAMSMCNERKSPSSCDGEKNWGSCFGNELDIVAPGVKIYTTDISGSAGYETSNYTATFNGTSSACPHAAGVMALILSVNRCLSQEDARRVLETSCDKVGAYCYIPGKPHGLWNNQMGYGRINAFKAVQYAISLQTNIFFNVSGSDQGASSNFTWILNSGGCSDLSAGTYVVKRREIRVSVAFPYTQAPIIVGSVNGFSATNPNNGNYYMDVVSLSETSATLRTWVYEVVSTMSGQQLSWIPTHPSNVKFNFTVLSAMVTDIYLQNQTVSTGTQVHNAMNKIETGSDVTNAVPIGYYIVEGDANVTLHGGNTVILKPGTHIKPGQGGYFRTYVDPFFTCEQFPMGKMTNNDGSFPPVIKDYEVEKLVSVPDNSKKECIVFKIYPNPSLGNANIEYCIDKSELIEISIHDNCGKPLYKLKNKSFHEAGTYQIKLTGINLPSGIYYCILQTDSIYVTKELIISK
ncbi:MAG: S8 family serine peptidase [Bacteroidales bacterium]|nr:S8 family serine peptidase [Bacteroidales bacterium]